MALKITLDSYTFQARIAPLLLAALPLAATLAFVAPGGVSTFSVLGGLVVWSGGALLAAEFTRDRGKKRQDELFSEWKAKPSVRLLRHVGARNKIQVEHWHQVLQRLLPDVAIPGQKDEEADPVAADQVYEVCERALREKTRDHKKFPLVFAENCSYGFRRNSWGLRPLGIASSSIAVVIVLVVGGMQWWKSGRFGEPTLLVVAGFDLVCLIFWRRLVTRDWVRSSAEAYGQQLLASCDSL